MIGNLALVVPTTVTTNNPLEAILDGSITANISGSTGSLIKAGAGYLELNGSNSYSGSDAQVLAENISIGSTQSTYEVSFNGITDATTIAFNASAATVLADLDTIPASSMAT